MADKAATGLYHDYLSPVDTPSTQLMNDLIAEADKRPLNTPERDAINILINRHANGEFGRHRRGRRRMGHERLHLAAAEGMLWAMDCSYVYTRPMA